MVAVMAEKKDRASGAKVTLGVRIEPELRAELESAAEEISQESFPASITAGELAAVAIREYLERYRKSKRRG